MHKKLSTILACVVAASLITSAVPASAYAASLRTTAEKTSFKTSNKSGELVKVTTSGSTITVKYASCLKGIKYRVGLRNVGTSGSWKTSKTIDASNKGFTVKLNVSKQSSGTYYLMIARAATKAQAQGYEYVGGSHGYVFAGIPIKVKSGKASVVSYSKIVSDNKKKRAASAEKGTKRYKTTSAKALNDMTFLFDGYDSYLPSEKKRLDYFATVSKIATKGATTPYQKLAKIYSFVAGNFYYDTIAFQNKSRQHINPYLNLRKLMDNYSSSNSKKTSGKYAKVATTCIGYSGMVIALARAAGIPCKLVYGHALTSPWNTWSTESGLDTRDHWWVEAYVDKKWRVVDATRGTNAKWNRSSGTWEKKTIGKLLNANYLSPSVDFFSNTHRIFGYYS